MKKLKFFPILILVMLSMTACNKLVSDKCALCGNKATKNYTNPQSIDLDISMEGNSPFKLKAGETVSFCDKCYGIAEIMVGKSK